MRTQAEHTSRAPAAGPGRDRRGSSASPAADTTHPAGAWAGLGAGGIAGLQAAAGNRAAAQAVRAGLVVQRTLQAGQAAALAARLHDAMAGWGTDEEAVYGALTGRSPDELDAIREAYFFAYDHTLLADIEDEFSGSELARARRLLEGHAAPAAGAAPEAVAADAVSLAHDIAQQLWDAMRGLGTNEDQIFNALEGRTPDQIAEIRRQYFAITGRSLDSDLRDDLSGDELRRALALVGSSESGSFSNSFSEYLTEDYQGGGRGIWEWEVADGKFLVHVGVKFEPDPGITAPIATWQSQIRGIWNRWAVTGNGGTAGGGFEYPIEFDLQNQAGAERSVRVRPNAVTGSYGSPDRAYSNLWYPVMRETIAPHEFGHLVGLPDEYERTREDYEAVTGQTIPGPENTSGKTPRQVADELHTALRLESAAQRAPGATTACEGAGLIVGGAAQQGTFAQQVMRSYNETYESADHENLLHAIRYRCAADSYWTLISVFSYTSSSIMGNESDHTHPVELRHMRFVLDVIRERHPEVTWGLRLLR